MVPRSGGGESGSTVIKLDTVRKIAEKVSRNREKTDHILFLFFLSLTPPLLMFYSLYSQDKHPLLDITPTAIERLNYIQYHPVVLFLDPHSRKDVKAMRQKYSPGSSKSSRRLYSQALKLRKEYSHLFAGNDTRAKSRHVTWEHVQLQRCSCSSSSCVFIDFFFPWLSQHVLTCSLTPTSGTRLWRTRYVTNSPNLSGCPKSRYECLMYIQSQTSLHLREPTPVLFLIPPTV